MTTFKNRESTFPIEPLLLSRVSSRAFSEERLSDEELMSLFEAARWAPSSYNNQPWRFVYARHDDKEWQILFNALIDFNKSWCRAADTLILVISRNNFERNNKPSRTARFDTGAAWMSLAIEAHARNIIAHAMQGFDYDAVARDLRIPNTFTVEAMVAIGKPGQKELLPHDLQDMEEPSARKPLESLISRGHCSFS